MTLLAQSKTTLDTTHKVPTCFTTMRVMTTDTGKLPLRSQRVLGAAERMRSTGHPTPNMDTIVNRFMTTETERIDLRHQLPLMRRSVGIVTGVAETGLDRPMDIFLTEILVDDVLVALDTKISVNRPLAKASLVIFQLMTGTALKSTGRTV